MFLALCLYFLSVASTFKSILTVGSILIAAFVVLGLCITIALLYDENSYADNFKKYLKTSIKTLLIICCINVIIPSEKTMYIILGILVTEKVYESEIGKELEKILLFKVKSYSEEIIQKEGKYVENKN